MKRKLFPLVLLPVLALSACGEIHQVPEQIKDDAPLVEFWTGDEKENVEIYNNLKKIIYDAKLDNGTVAKNVLDDVLLEIAKSVYGEYDKLLELSKKTKDDKAVTDFIDNHKVYQSIDQNDKRIENEADKEFTRLKLTATRIKDRIANNFFNAIKGNYTRDGYFFEEDYLMSLRNSLKDVAKPAPQTKGIIIPPEFDGKNVFAPIDEETGPLLHIENYTGEYDYMKKDVLPEIYRELLVEQYLFNSSYPTIARAYARNVEIITIANREDDKLTANKLMNAYVDTYINTNEEFTNEPSFDIITAAWRGYGLPAVGNKNGSVKEQATYLLKDVMGLQLKQYNNGVADEDPAFIASGVEDYFPGTSYGSLVKKLEKVKKNAKTTDTSIESDFTNNGEYTVERGFEAKKVKVQQESYITDGWHIRNGGLSSLNEKIRTRLFNIGVANALDKENLPADQQYPDRFQATGYTNSPEGENPYVAKINGRYFLKPSVSERQDDASVKTRDMLWYDEAADSYTIVEIKEAVSSAKLALFSDDNYENRGGEANKVAGFEKMETIAHEVAYEIAKGESYKSLSTKHWLKIADLKYHDDTILEYFQTNYPELFEK